ncbi:hypothetical protein HPP92_026128 [Vanilla planifolia]|uniref:Uncharacterized protein n=1 Tax=Vanilla planifolia TaxID=51239 RepID=A0A835PL09_VANPL|nr:hypothetical protein HPP92_026128 [Vanilla planifolia]
MGSWVWRRGAIYKRKVEILLGRKSMGTQLVNSGRGRSSFTSSSSSTIFNTKKTLQTTFALLLVLQDEAGSYPK